MRILFTSFPARGHFHPLAPLALAARESGHDVRIASGSDLCSWASQAGFESTAVGLTQADALRVTAETYPGPAGHPHLFTDVWVSAALPDLVSMSRAWRPQLIVHEEGEYAGPLLAAIVGVPCVTHSWNAPARPLGGRREAEQLLVPLWEAYASGRAPRVSGDLYLDACPGPFQTEEIAGFTDVVAVRPILFDGPAMPPPGWLTDVASPAAYVTFGTVSLFSKPAMLALAARAMSPLVATVIVTTGPNPVESLGPLPPNVRALPYLPQSLVLDRVRLVVSHGGAGSAVGALLHALPHLVLPQGAQSQLAIGRAVTATGSGSSLSNAQQHEEAIARAAAQLLDDPGSRARAAELRRDLERRPAPGEVLRLLVDRLA